MLSTGDLRERVRFDRRAQTEDEYGNVRTDWSELCTVWAKVLPKPAGRDETVQASRLAGTALYTIQVRSSSMTRQLTPADRAVVITAAGPIPAGTVLNIRSAVDLNGLRDVITMDVELGVAS